MKPILFNTEMVQAILDGRKTCTRRVVKPHFRPEEIGWQVITEVPSGKYVRIEYLDEWEDVTRYMSEPFHPGDILYVRETWCSAYDGERYFYLADKCTYREEKQLLDYDEVKWRPSIHMPREAARIFLRVTDVRVERLQDCGNMQAKDEGCSCCSHFARIWDETIKPSDRDTYGWAANPWVWVIDFERCEKPEEADHG